MAIILANNATSKLSGSITAAATSIAVQSGEGAKFPSPVSPNWFPVTLIDADGNIEICQCTARSGDILTVARGREGTTARAFSDGSRVSLRITKGVLDYVFGVVDQLAGTTISSFAKTMLDDANESTVLSTLGVSSFIKTLLDDADAASALTTLGVSTFIQGLLNDADAASAMATLGAQPSDATLTALAGLTGAADRLPYFNGADTAALATFTSFARSLLDDADAAAARATLGVMSTDEPYKSAADVATTNNFSSTYTNGSSGVGAKLTASAVGVTTIDGVALTAGMRVLVKNQTTSAQNGVYTVTTAGTASVATVLTRATDCDSASRLAGAVITVDQGSTNGAGLYTNDFKKSYVIGTNAINWRNVFDSGNSRLNDLQSGNFAAACAAIGAAQISDFLCYISGSVGYLKIPRRGSAGPTKEGDLIIQWGKTGAIGSNTGVAVTFPTAFPVSCFAVVTGCPSAGMVGNSPPTLGGLDSTITTNTPTTTGFTLYYHGSVSTSGGFWLAIGR